MSAGQGREPGTPVGSGPNKWLLLNQTWTNHLSGTRPKPITSVGAETTSLRAGPSKRPQLEHSRIAEWPPLTLKDLLESWATSRVTRTTTMRNNHLILESGFSQFHFDLIPYCVWLSYIVGLWEWANSALTFPRGIRELKED